LFSPRLKTSQTSTLEVVGRAYAKAKEINTRLTVTEKSKRVLFGQTAATLVGR
jgi:hypothetical protein